MCKDKTAVQGRSFLGRVEEQTIDSPKGTTPLAFQSELDPVNSLSLGCMPFFLYLQREKVSSVLTTYAMVLSHPEKA